MRTRLTVFVALILLVVFAATVRSQPASTPGPVYDASNQAYRVNVVAGGGAGGTSSTFGTAFPGTGTAVGGKDPSGAMASFTISNTGRLQTTCDNCSSSAATFGTGFPTSGGPVGGKDANGAFASVTVTNSRLDVNALTTGATYGTLAPTTGTAIGVKDSSGALASLTSTNGRLDTQPASGAFVNVAKFNNDPVQTGTGTSGAGIPRVTVSSDSVIASITAALGIASNSFINVAKFGNDPVVTGTGTAGAGIPRVTVSSDSALTTVSTVTAVTSVTNPVGVASGSFVNVAKVNNDTVNVNIGTAGAGTQRVAIASDSQGNGGDNQAVPTRLNYIGGRSGSNATGYIRCDSFASISTSNAGNWRLVASSSGTNVYICGYAFVAGTTPVGVKFLQGRDDGSLGSACTGTVAGTADLTGVMGVAASGGVVNALGITPVLKTSTNYGLCINLSVGGQVSGHLSYTQF